MAKFNQVVVTRQIVTNPGLTWNIVSMQQYVEKCNAELNGFKKGSAEYKKLAESRNKMNREIRKIERAEAKAKQLAEEAEEARIQEFFDGYAEGKWDQLIAENARLERLSKAANEMPQRLLTDAEIDSLIACYDEDIQFDLLSALLDQQANLQQNSSEKDLTFA